jgi:RNA polymerase sigma-70 factor, ECF subfamily
MESPEITQLLAKASEGDKSSENQLLSLVYEELRRLAASYMRRERADHTLQPSALVNEAYLKMIGSDSLSWESRGQFYAAAARTMRNILIDYARGHTASKRGGIQQRVELHEGIAFVEGQAEEILAIDEALEKLKSLDPRQSEIVELRYFAGLSVEETAAALGISERTVKRDWSVARAWLQAELSGIANL